MEVCPQKTGPHNDESPRLRIGGLLVRQRCEPRRTGFTVAKVQTLVADPSPRVLFSAPRNPARPDDSKNGSSPWEGRLRESGPGDHRRLSRSLLAEDQTGRPGALPEGSAATVRSRLSRRRSAPRAGPWLLPSDEAGSDASQPPRYEVHLVASQQLDGRAQQGGHSVTSVWWGRRTRVPGRNAHRDA